jgi:hypothetical protein
MRASRLARAADLNYAIRRRASHGGPGGRGIALNATSLARIGFVDVSPGSKLPIITPLFIRYVLDPLSVLKENPGLRPTRLEMDVEEVIFYFICQRDIIHALQSQIKKERNDGFPLTTETRVKFIHRALRARKSIKLPWEEEIWHDLRLSGVLSQFGTEHTTDVRNLHRIGFIDASSHRDALKRITPRFIQFIVDPAGFFRKNPGTNPFKSIKGFGEISFFGKVHVTVVEMLQNEFIDAGRSTEVSTEVVVNHIYRRFQQRF